MMTIVNTHKNDHSPILDVWNSWRRERPDLDLGNFLLGISIMRLGRMLDDAYDRKCRRHFNISGSDMRVLFALRRAGKPYVRRPTDLFRSLLVTSGAITKQVDRLSNLGFVERLANFGNSSGVGLTAKGLKAANAASEMMAEKSPLAPGVKMLTPEERENGIRFVEKILLELEAADSMERPNVKTRSSVGRSKSRRHPTGKSSAQRDTA